MKTAIALLAIGLFFGLIAPYLWGDCISSAGVQFPQFIWSKSPPRIIHLTATGFFRAVGLVFILLSAVLLIVLRSRP